MFVNENSIVMRSFLVFCTKFGATFCWLFVSIYHINRVKRQNKNTIAGVFATLYKGIAIPWHWVILVLVYNTLCIIKI